MADKTIILGVEVTDKGTAKKLTADLNAIKAKLFDVTNASKQTTDSIDQTTKSAQGLNQEFSRMGGAATTAKIKAVTSGIKDQQKQFDIARGSAESSGAAARDFANQSRGLGGLVRIYATFAANIFAVGVAFRALSSAMDTANMVEGLNQLGAAGGRNLGGLSKRVAELSGGAISLAEAMRAVAQTTSAGISSRDIERIANVAKSASVALGVAMPDAIQRLSRGITKLEPELLDELGLMTRLEPAVEIYARQVGKAASQLTQFERRQAFANAVLAEGELKFGAIADVAANPYDKLLAAIKDVSQVGITFLNSFLVPVAELLAANPFAITAGIAALVALIGKQAIPALGEFKNGLIEAANAADELAAERVAASAEATELVNKDLNAQIAAQTEANKRLSAAEHLRVQDQEASVRKISKLRDRTLAQSVVGKAEVESITPQELAALDRRADILERGNKKSIASAVELRKITASVREEQALSAKAQEAANNVLAAERAIIRDSTTLQANRALALRATEVATKKNIISNAAHNAGLIGVKGAYTILNAEIAKSGLTLSWFDRIMLKSRATMAIYTASIAVVTTALFKLGNVMAAVGIAVAVFGVISSMFSKNAKEAAAFSSAIDDANSSLDNMNRTLLLIKKNASSGTIQGIQAIAEAFDNLTRSMQAAIETANAKDLSASGFDKVLDSLAGIFSFTKLTSSTDQDLAKTLSRSIRGSLDALSQSGLKSEAEAKFRDILGVNSFDTSSIERALEGLSRTAKSGIVEAFREVSLVLSNTSSKLQGFVAASTAADLALARFIQSTSSKDPVFVLGAALQNLSKEMFNIANSSELAGEQIEAAMAFLRANPGSGVLFGEKFVKGLINMREEFKNGKGELVSFDQAVKDLQDRIAKTPFNELLGGPSGGGDSKIATLQKELASVQAAGEKQAAGARQLFLDGLDDAFKKGSSLISVSLGLASEKAAITVARATLQGLSGERRASAENDIARREIDINIKSIETNIDLIRVSEGLKAAIEESTAQQALATAISTGQSQEKVAELQRAANISTVFSELISKNLPLTIEHAIKAGASELEAKAVQLQGLGISQRTAGQEATLKGVLATRDALGITGEANIRQGRLQDQQLELDLQGKIAAANTQRAQLLQRVVNLNTENIVLQQAESFKASTLAGQQREALAVEVAIANAKAIGRQDEVDVQERVKTLTLERHEIELTNNSLQFANQLISARFQAFMRLTEIQKLNQAEEFAFAGSELSMIAAENVATKELFNITESFNARQQAALAIKRAEQEFFNTEALEEISMAERKFELEQAIATIRETDPNDEGGNIARITEELDRQTLIRDKNISLARIEMNTQTAVATLHKASSLELARQNRILAAGSSLAHNLENSFGKVGSSLGSMVSTFATLSVTLERSAGAMRVLVQRRAELVGKGKTDTREFAEIQEDIARQQVDNNMSMINGFASAAGAAKTFFEEGSKGYEIFAAAEKAFTLVSIALTAQRLISEIAYTQAATGLAAERIGMKVVEAEVDGVAGVIKTMASLPFPLNLAAGAAVAAIMTGLLMTIGGKGPGGVKGSSGMSAEEVQKTQGTGQDYVNGKLVNNGGGALGASDEKVKDIANSLTKIKDVSLLTSDFGRRSLSILEKIEANTRSLSASVISSTNILEPTSAFGTKEKSSGGFFGKKKTSIIDKGVLFDALLLDLLEGNVLVQEFETLKKTKKSLFGKKKTSFTVNTKDLDDSVAEGFQLLFSDLVETALVATEELISGSSASIEGALQGFKASFKVSGFDLSGEEFSEAILAESNVIINQLVGESLPILDAFRDLGEGFLGTLLRLAANTEVVEDRLGRIGIDFAAELDTLPLLAEDIFTRLVSVGGKSFEMLDAIVSNSSFNKRGAGTANADDLASLAGSQQQFFTELTQAAKNFGGIAEVTADNLISAQVAFTDTTMAILGSNNALQQFTVANRILNGELSITGNNTADTANGISTSVKEYVESSKLLSRVVDTMISVFTDRTGITIQATDNLVKGFGGLESFVEKTSYLFDNFFSEEDQLAAKTRELNSAFVDLNNEGYITESQVLSLVDGIGDLKTEFLAIFQSTGLLTPAAVEASNAIATLAPAVVEVAESVGTFLDILSNVNLSTEDFTGILEEAVVGKLDPATLGKDIAETIRDGFYLAISASFVKETSNTIVNSLITPLLSGMLNASFATSAVVTTTMDLVVTDILRKADNLAIILSDVRFAEALGTITEKITTVVSSINDNARLLSMPEISEFSSILKDAVLGNLDPADIGNSVAKSLRDGFFEAISASFVSDVTNTLVTNLITPLLSGMLNMSVISAAAITATMDTIAMEIQLKAEALAMVLSNSNFLSLLSGITSTISTAITLVNNNARSSIDKAGDAFNVLTKAVDRERAALQAAFDSSISSLDSQLEALEAPLETVAKSISNLSSLADALKTAVNTINPPSLAQARNILGDALVSLRAGSTIDPKDLAPALSVLTSNSTSGFSSELDFIRSQSTNANIIEALRTEAMTQLSAEEQALIVLRETQETLEAQKQSLESSNRARNLALDNILANAQSSLDALTSINTGILDVATALTNFTAAVLAALQAVPPATGTIGVQSGTGVISGEHEGFGPNTVKRISDAEIKAFASVPGRTGLELVAAAKANGLSASRVGQVLGYSPTDVSNFLAANNIRPFANGGVTPGGEVLVGEIGPEIIDLPKGTRVHSNSDSRSLNNKELVEEIKQLRADMNAILFSIAASTGKTAAKINKFDINGMPPVRAA